MRRLGAILLVAALAGTPGVARADGIAITAGSDPVESAPVQIGVSGSATDPGERVYLEVQAAGTACAANQNGGGGDVAINGDLAGATSFSETKAWGFASAGSYRL